MEYSIHREKKVKLSFISLLLCYYLICFKYASLCNLVKLVNILRSYAASEEKRSQKDSRANIFYKEKRIFQIYMGI